MYIHSFFLRKGLYTPTGQEDIVQSKYFLECYSSEVRLYAEFEQAA